MGAGCDRAPAACPTATPRLGLLLRLAWRGEAKAAGRPLGLCFNRRRNVRRAMWRPAGLLLRSGAFVLVHELDHPQTGCEMSISCAMLRTPFTAVSLAMPRVPAGLGPDQLGVTMIRVQSAVPPVVPVVPLAVSIHRDLEVSRYDHVPQGASWLQDIVAEAARVADVPAAVINLMKSTTQRTVAAVGAEPTFHDRKDSMCGRILEEGRTVHVADASLDERWARNPFVNGRWANVRFYGAHPLVAPSGLVIGTLCVFDQRPRELRAASIAELDELASLVVTQLEESRVAALRAGLRRWGNGTARS